MTGPQTLSEFRAAWLPHIADRGLARLADLLERGDPTLIHGSFQRSGLTGCLATHIAWHHPRTRHLNEEAGVIWLAHVARLNPATSFVIRDWDRSGHADWPLRTGLLAAIRDEQSRREQGDASFEMRPVRAERRHPCLAGV
jgi:hypothetical protein